MAHESRTPPLYIWTGVGIGRMDVEHGRTISVNAGRNSPRSERARNESERITGHCRALELSISVELSFRIVTGRNRIHHAPFPDACTPPITGPVQHDARHGLRPHNGRRGSRSIFVATAVQRRHSDTISPRDLTLSAQPRSFICRKRVIEHDSMETALLPASGAPASSMSDRVDGGDVNEQARCVCTAFSDRPCRSCRLPYRSPLSDESDCR